MSFRRATIAEFWREVTVGEQPRENWSKCWNFHGTGAYSGYRAFRCVLAHRAAAVIFTGQIPDIVRQSCGNKNCVNVGHLNIIQNAVFKARYSPITGKPITHRVKDHKQIMAILAERGEDGRYLAIEIARKLDVSRDTVRKALREAPLFDLLAEHKACNGKVQLLPESLIKSKEVG